MTASAVFFILENPDISIPLKMGITAVVPILWGIQIRRTQLDAGDKNQTALEYYKLNISILTLNH